MSKRQEAIDLIAERIRSAGEIGSFSFGLTLLEGGFILSALREQESPDNSGASK